MKNQNYEISFKTLKDTELQEIDGGGIISWIKNRFTPTRVTPIHVYNVPNVGIVEARIGEYPAMYGRRNYGR